MLLPSEPQLCTVPTELMAEQLQVEVAFALPEKQVLFPLTVDQGATIADVIAASGLAERFPNESIRALETGIWGRPAARDRCVEEGDRVELYRPLQRDPREARRELAQSGLTMSKPETG
jgi:putative ubiquitin-RnfH superfamily antitoxin RatB of RatAB toxin-antitoxin module